MERPELTYDGFGINGPDEHRTRLATFSPGACANGQADKYGPIFAESPAMLAALRRAVQRGAYSYTTRVKGQNEAWCDECDNVHALLARIGAG